MWECILILSLLSSMGGCQDRNLSTEVNPGCSECLNDTTLVYTRAVGTHDTVHHVWDVTGGRPTVIVAVTDVNASLHLTWADERPVSFTWSSEPRYSFAFVIDQLWEYNDLNDSGVWKPEWPRHWLDTEALVWTRTRLRHDGRAVSLAVQADLGTARDARSTITVEWSLVSWTGYGPALPHLVQSANSSLTEVSLANASRGDYGRSRLALALSLVSTDSAAAAWTQQLTKSLDDEHTPGVFEMLEVVSPATRSAGAGGFVQFRPVSYTARAREVTASTEARLGRLNRTAAPAPRSTAGRYFAGRDRSALLCHTALVSFGSAGDGFYTRTNFTSWSVSAGYGRPPPERFSPAALAVLGAGLALPLLALLAGAAWLLLRARGSGDTQRLLHRAT